VTAERYGSFAFDLNVQAAQNIVNSL